MLNPIQPILNGALQQSSIGVLLSDVKLSMNAGLVSQIYSILWELIVSVRLMPGQQVSEKDIAQACNASKTPVREALIRLEDTGLVTVVPKSGTYVAPISVDAYFEACFIRLQLGIGAVRHAAERNHTGRRLNEMDDIIAQLAQCSEQKEWSRFLALDEQLHEMFFVMAGVPGVWNVLRRSQSEIYRVRHLKTLFAVNRRAGVWSDKRAIVDAIRSGDADKAQAELERQLGSLEKERQELLAMPELLTFIETSGLTRSRGRITAA